MHGVPVHVASLRSEDLNVACAAALEAAKIIREAWENPPDSFQEKDGHYDLVSEVDERADHAIQNILRRRFPNDKILSEELNPDIACDITKSRVWIIDPLDGTACFLFKADPFSPTVMIALLENGNPSISVVVQPIVDRWTYALRDTGAFTNGKQVHVAEPSFKGLSQAWVDMNHYGDYSFESEWFKRIDMFTRGPKGARLVSRSPPYSGIALRLLRDAPSVAPNMRGLDACVHDHNPKKPKQLPWDILAIQLIIQEAGGAYVDADRGCDETLDPFNLRGPIVVGHPSVVKYILENA
jgi:myo-inositol-1(or 4)-monophosphatase